MPGRVSRHVAFAVLMLTGLPHVGAGANNSALPGWAACCAADTDASSLLARDLVFGGVSQVFGHVDTVEVSIAGWPARRSHGMVEALARLHLIYAGVNHFAGDVNGNERRFNGMCAAGVRCAPVRHGAGGVAFRFS